MSCALAARGANGCATRRGPRPRKKSPDRRDPRQPEHQDRWPRRAVRLGRQQEDQRAQAAPADRHARLAARGGDHPPPACRIATEPSRCCAAPNSASADGPSSGPTRVTPANSSPWVKQLRPRGKLHLDIVRSPKPTKGFAVQPRRWVIERSFAWLTRCRRLVKDYERLRTHSAAFIHLAFTGLMLRFLTR